MILKIYMLEGGWIAVKLVRRIKIAIVLQEALQ